jgi:MFS family permease
MSVLLHRQEGERTYREMFKRYGRRVFIAMSAQALAQLNGINVISYYAPYLFERAGWLGRDAILMAGINGLTYVASTIPPWYIVDRWGRRPILLTGAIAMMVSLSLISYVNFLAIPATPKLVVILVVIYNAAFGYSWGPIPWLYPPEILPLKIRSKGASLSTATNWAFNWLVGQMTPLLQEWISWRLYLVHAFWCGVCFIGGTLPPPTAPVSPNILTEPPSNSVFPLPRNLRRPPRRHGRPLRRLDPRPRHPGVQHHPGYARRVGLAAQARVAHSAA